MTKQKDQNEFEHLAHEASPGFIKEVWYLVANDKRWWMAPIIIALVILGALVMLTGTGVAPFIYTLF